MGLDVNEIFECTSDKDISCYILGCIYFDKNLINLVYVNILN